MKFQSTPSQSSSGASLPFIKLKDGERLVGVFKGNPYEFHHIFSEKRVVPEGTKGAAFRFRINFITKEGASYVPKVWEQGVTVYRMLKDLNESYPLEETVVEIKRSGSTKDDTTYSILPLPPKNQPSEAGWKVINQVQLLSLEHEGVKKDEAPWPDEPPHVDGEELPF